MPVTILPFDTFYMEQLSQLPPAEWQSDAYLLFLYNEWQPWFFPFQAVEDDRLVGFGMFFLFGDFAWLGWILTHTEHRNKGIGTAITKHLLMEATEKGARGFILTATEMGKPIYEKLGFVTTSYYRFFQLPEQYNSVFDKEFIRKASRNDLPAIFELDFNATGEDRPKLIESNLSDCYVYENQTIEGFFMPSLGNGFIVASTERAGVDLINYRCASNKKVIVVPDENSIAVDYLLKTGFIEGYKIPRMTLGKQPQWHPGMIYSRASGYCG